MCWDGKVSLCLPGGPDSRCVLVVRAVGMMPASSALLSVQGSRHPVHSGARVLLHMHKGALSNQVFSHCHAFFCLKSLT